MATIVSNVTTLFTGAMTMAGSVLSTITTEGNEILLVYAIVPLVGLGIGVTHRLFNVAK